MNSTRLSPLAKLQVNGIIVFALLTVEVSSSRAGEGAHAADQVTFSFAGLEAEGAKLLFPPNWAATE